MLRPTKIFPASLTSDVNKNGDRSRCIFTVMHFRVQSSPGGPSTPDRSIGSEIRSEQEQKKRSSNKNRNRWIYTPLWLNNGIWQLIDVAVMVSWEDEYVHSKQRWRRSLFHRLLEPCLTKKQSKLLFASTIVTVCTATRSTVFNSRTFFLLAGNEVLFVSWEHLYCKLKSLKRFAFGARKN